MGGDDETFRVFSRLSRFWSWRVTNGHEGVAWRERVREVREETHCKSLRIFLESLKSRKEVSSWSKECVKVGERARGETFPNPKSLIGAGDTCVGWHMWRWVSEQDVRLFGFETRGVP